MPPTVTFNTGTGSDTAASGSGGTIVTAGGNDGAATDGTTVVDLSADTPDLSGVATDGTEVLWVDSTTGPQFGVITAVDDGADTVTCAATTFTQTEGSRNWGIGGKRANWSAAAQLFADYATGWIIETETDQALTAALVPSVALTVDEQVTIRGSAAFKVITQSSSGIGHFAPSASALLFFENLHFKHSHATPEYAVVDNGSIVSTFYNCICGDVNAGDNPKGFVRRGSTGTTVSFVNCEARHCTEDGIGDAAGRGALLAHGCSAHHCGRNGFAMRGDGGIILFGCLAYDNTGIGISLGGGADLRELTVAGCTSANNGSDGIAILDKSVFLTIYNNNITGNGGYGINSTDDLAGLSKFFIDFNNFGTGADAHGGANTSGALNNIDAGANDLAVDPLYTDAANDDFSIGDTTAKAGGFPDAASTIGAGQSATASYVDIGTAQREEAGGFDGPSVYNVGPA